MPRRRRLSLGHRFLDYLLQVSLIILGLVVATGVDRCNAARKDDRRLVEYYQAIYQDLESEERSDSLNIHDATVDLTALEDAIRLFRTGRMDSLVLGASLLNGVLGKGVFRTFSPTTFDVMVNTGDISLITDLSLRSDLAVVFAFRSDIIKRDLVDYDRRILTTVDELSDRIDPYCLLSRRVHPDCIVEPSALAGGGNHELALLSIAASVRLFHLKMAQRQVREMMERMVPLLNPGGRGEDEVFGN